MPAPPIRNSSLTAEQQWEEARVYWEMVVGVWENRAEQEGISPASVGMYIIQTFNGGGARLAELT